MHARASIHIDAPVEKVDALTSAPAAWEEYVVGMGHPDEIAGDGGPGTRVGIPMHMAGKAFHLTYHVKQHECGQDGATHWRAEISGDSRGWETFDLTPEDGGTRAVAEMEAEPFRGAAYRLAAWLFVERIMNRDYQRTMVNLKRLVESS